MNPEKLAKLQAASRTGGKGSVRRKVKKVTKAPVDDKKLQAALKKLGAQQITGIDEVNMFRPDGTILHFKFPKVQALSQGSAFAINGTGQEKTISDLSPGIITQLGAEAMNSLRQIAETQDVEELLKGQNSDRIPELVDFEKVSEM